jgi:hypothetical protein
MSGVFKIQENSKLTDTLRRNMQMMLIGWFKHVHYYTHIIPLMSIGTSGLYLLIFFIELFTVSLSQAAGGVFDVIESDEENTSQERELVFGIHAQNR